MSVDDLVRIPRFAGKNFQGWKKQVLVVLENKDLVKCLDLDYMQEHIDDKSRKKCDAMAQSVLYTAMTPAVVEEVIGCENASTIWERLLAIYENSSDTNVERLLHNFHSYTKPSHFSMSQHISHIESLALQLRQVNEPQSDRAIMSKMMNSLPDIYNNLKTAWDSTHPEFKTKKELVDRLIKEEVKSKVDLNTREVNKDMAMVAKSGRFHKSHAHNQKIKQTRCFKCGLLGHWARNCKSRVDSHKHNSDYGKSNDVSNDTLIMTIGISNDCDDRWLMDSGASFHVCQFREQFVTYEALDLKLKVGGGYVNAIGKGSVKLTCITQSGKRILELVDVLHIPDMGINLFSIGKAQLSGAEIKTHGNGTYIYKHGQIVASGTLNKSSAMTTLETESSASYAMVMKAKRTLDEWHQALGHTNPSMIEKMAKEGIVDGIKIAQPDEEACGVCPLGKGTRAIHTHDSSINPVAVGDHIDIDLVGPISESLGGKKYVLTCKDRYSGYCHTYLLRNKSEVHERLQDYFAAFECESGHRVKLIRTDNGSEFNNDHVRVLCGIEHVLIDFSAPYCPEQNGAAERNNRTLIETARTMLSANPSLPRGLWAEAINTATYIRNRVPKTGNNKTPFELYTGRKPRVDHIVPFGTQVHTLLSDRRKVKFDPRTEAGYIVGFTNRSNTYRVFVPDGPKIKITPDVIFRMHNKHRTQVDSTVSSRMVPTATINIGQSNVAVNSSNVANEGMEEIPSPEYSPMKSNATETSDFQESSNRFQSSCDGGQPEALFLMNTIMVEAPKNYMEAVTGPNRDKWRAAINSELKAHLDNGTWAVAERPKEGLTLTSKWIFVPKKDLNGNLLCKARLVARGFQQREGIDYKETFAPVARSDSIRLILALAAVRKLSIERFDVSTAFLNGTIEEDIYIEPPEGVNVKSRECLKLKKALYGLKQAPKVWNSTFDKVIKSLGFVPIKSDSCVYRNNTNMYLAIYVDDGLVVGPNGEACLELIKTLNNHFNTRHVKEFAFLGIELEQIGDDLHLGQKNYIESMLKQFNMNESQGVTTPLADTKVLFEIDDGPNVIAPYRSAIGSLLFAALNTRPDILFPTILLSRFNENPKQKHWNAVRRIMKYLRQTTSIGLLYRSCGDRITIEAYSDADWGSDLANRKSTTGVVILVCHCPVIFISRQQDTVALSSAEAEYMAACEATKQLSWLTTFLSELGVQFDRPRMFVDNTSAIEMVKTKELKRRSKHIDIRNHYVREKFAMGLFDIEYVKTGDQKADFLTKHVGGPQLVKLLNSNNIVSKITDM